MNTLIDIILKCIGLLNNLKMASVDSLEAVQGPSIRGYKLCQHKFSPIQ